MSEKTHEGGWFAFDDAWDAAPAPSRFAVRVSACAATVVNNLVMPAGAVALAAYDRVKNWKSAPEGGLSVAIGACAEVVRWLVQFPRLVFATDSDED